MNSCLIHRVIKPGLGVYLIKTKGLETPCLQLKKSSHEKASHFPSEWYLPEVYHFHCLIHVKPYISLLYMCTEGHVGLGNL